MNTTENNKLIAEFMELKTDKMFFNLKTGNYVKKENEDCEVNAVTVFIKNNKPVTNFNYHSDWNWLMEVVEKIRKFHNGTEPLSDKQIEQLLQLIKKLNESLILRNGISIEAVYNACVEFIKWYNEQK